METGDILRVAFFFRKRKFLYTPFLKCERWSVALSIRATTLLSLCATTIEPSVTSYYNAAVVPRDKDPATPTHPDVLAQPLPGHTTPTPSDEASVTSTTLLSNWATTRRMSFRKTTPLFGGFWFFWGGRAHADDGVHVCGQDIAGEVFSCP